MYIYFLEVELIHFVFEGMFNDQYELNYTVFDLITTLCA